METMEQVDLITESIINGQWKQAADQTVELIEENDCGYSDILEIIADGSTAGHNNIFRLMRVIENNHHLTLNGVKL